MTTCAWIWLYIGAFLMLAELLAPGFVVFFFGLSAATVGLLRALLGDSFDLTWQLAAFSACSVLYIVFLRRLCKKLFVGATSGIETGCEIAGRLGKVTEAISPNLPGRVMLGDAEWTAVAEVPLAVGANVRVVAQENLTLKVEAVN